MTGRDHLYKPLQDLTDWEKVRERIRARRMAKSEFDDERLRTELRKKIAGQDHVLDELATVIRDRFASMHAGVPIAKLMFFGPSGTGKTETAKLLAKHIFKSEPVRVNFNELAPKTEAEVSTILLGMREGYTGANIGLFMRELSSTPNSIVLLEEVEKAKDKPRIFSMLLTALDEGYSTDSWRGQKVDWSKTIVVMTGNAEFERLNDIQNSVHDPDQRQASLRHHLEASGTFSPELLARMDWIFVFRPIDEETMAEVLALKVQDLAAKYSFRLEHIDGPVFDFFADRAAVRVQREGVRAIETIVKRELERALQGASRKNQGREAAIQILCEGDRLVIAALPQDAAPAEEPAASDPGPEGADPGPEGADPGPEGADPGPEGGAPPAGGRRGRRRRGDGPA